VPVQPAAGYELLFNLILIVALLYSAQRYRRPGMQMITYLFGYTITQFLVFFARANIVVPLFTLSWGLKQAQWTSLIVFLVLIPLTLWVRRWRYAQSIPEDEIPAIFGIPQKQVEENEQASKKRLGGK
jgi:phosphatidylglycerol---prolipoprotein diacylglyceryl transferase